MTDERIFHFLTKEYSVVLATTTEEIEAVKDIRNDVLLHKYSKYPDLKEAKWYLYNQDDKQSFNYLLRHNASGQYVGTVRLFFINQHTPSQVMPMQRDSNIENLESLVQDLPICEVSRFALSTNLIPYEDFSELKLRTYLSLGLMIATRINLFLYQYSTVFSIMEISLHRILKRQGTNFQQIGEAVNYYGTRIPFAINRKKLLLETEKNMGRITRFYLNELCQNPNKISNFTENNSYLKYSDTQVDKICHLLDEYGEDVALEKLLEA